MRPCEVVAPAPFCISAVRMLALRERVLREQIAMVTSVLVPFGKPLRLISSDASPLIVCCAPVHTFEEKREAVMAGRRCCLDDLNVFGSFGVFRFPLQFPLSLMIELLISALRFSGLLPNLIGAANNLFILAGFFIADFLLLSAE
jgi:hypothetical protein